jgi:glycosyltransferase involved in cell wall biosynthesis
VQDVTICLGTILRDDSLYDCLASIRETYPDVKVAVADDGHHSSAKTRKMNGFKVDYHKLPFDSGLSRKRNHLINHVATPYVAMVDDDMIINQDARLPELRELMSVADLAAGKVRYPSGGTMEYTARLHFRPGREKVLMMRPLKSPWEQGGVKWRRTHLALNCFVARTDVLRSVGWDNRFKTTYEHLDFFLRMRLTGRYVVFTPESVFDETRARNPEYSELRGRHEVAKEIFFRKWGLGKVEKDRSLMTGAERKAAGG